MKPVRNRWSAWPIPDVCVVLYVLCFVLYALALLVYLDQGFWSGEHLIILQQPDVKKKTSGPKWHHLRQVSTSPRNVILASH